MKPSGLPKETIAQMTKEICVNISNLVKKSALENKVLLHKLRNDLHSGDSVRVENAINQIEAIFDKDIKDADEVLDKFKTKPDNTSIDSKSDK